MTVQSDPQPWGGFDDLDLDVPGQRHSPAEVADQVKRDLGIDVPRRWHPPEHPGVSGLAEGLGLK